MKYLKCILLFFVIVSCSNDDDTLVTPNPDVINSSGLDGKWNLVSVTGGFIGVDHFFEKGIIVWDFNETSKTINVINNNTDTTLEDWLSTGTYSYSIVTTESNKELLINDISRGNFELTNSEFIIDEQFRDGFRYVFER